MGQFGIGQPVRRKEDIRLITGQGCYTDDFNIDGQAHVQFLRSPHAHADILSIDTSKAETTPGAVSAFDVSMERISAWACGERRNWTWACPSMLKSSV